MLPPPKIPPDPDAPVFALPNTLPPLDAVAGAAEEVLVVTTGFEPKRELPPVEAEIEELAPPKRGLFPVDAPPPNIPDPPAPELLFDFPLLFPPKFKPPKSEPAPAFGVFEDPGVLKEKLPAGVVDAFGAFVAGVPLPPKFKLILSFSK